MKISNGARYNHKKIERKWQKKWESSKLYEVKEKSAAKKLYVLDMFPYPSAQGLHVGHPEGYTASDIVTRYKMMRGYNVLHPMGWDAFGLPAENYAIKTGVHPAIATAKNIKNFRRQIKSLGFAYDWSREINTTDPEYYKWTQWIFLQLFKAGLAYEAVVPINFCPSCKTGIANEEVIGGLCERCKTKVVKKDIRQWMLKITAYAERLLNDLKLLDWPERIKEMQKNWIGRSEGAEINFEINEKINFILLHGYQGTAQTNFLPWLKKELERHGHSVFVPNLPNTANPTEKEQMNYVLKYAKFTKNTVILGHSLGAVVAMKVLEKVNTKIRGLITIGGFVEPKFKDNPRSFVKNFVWSFDFQKIRRQVGFVKVFSAFNDYAVPREQGKKLADLLNGTLFEVTANGEHFCSSSEPKILEQLLSTIKVFTTRPDTLFGATYLVLAPEHLAISKLKSQISNLKEVEKYVCDARQKTDLERTDLAKIKTGVELQGVLVKNPATGKNIPVWAADYVLSHYGTGAIMAVPGHDSRDFEFAKKFDLPIVEVIMPEKRKFVAGEDGGMEPATLITQAYEGEGILINSEKFNGLDSREARAVITKFVGGKKEINYKLRDWIFSRQRYWGEPIPLVFCENCAEKIKNQKSKIKNRGELLNPGWAAISEKNLPLRLPNIKSYKPIGTGESPLAAVENWVNTKCPKCDGPAERETNTMPNWAGDSWYYLAYTMLGNKKSKIKNKKYEWDKTKIKYWLPVDLYIGGAEHAVLHLLYARFWHKFLFDKGFVNTLEPFMKLKNQGLILGEDGQKMSKSRGNVVNPDDVIKKFGADAMRMYEMFIGPFEDTKPWSTKGIIGICRFIEKVWKIYNSKSEIRNSKFETNPKSKIPNLNDSKLIKSLHKTIKKVTEDIENFKFNTAISAMMVLVNEFMVHGSGFMAKNEKIAEDFLKILSPFAPHLAEELWANLGHKKSIFLEKWPEYDKKLITEVSFVLVIQINGKIRDTIKIAIDTTKEKAEKIALGQEKIKKYVVGKKIIKVIYVPGRIINFVVR